MTGKGYDALSGNLDAIEDIIKMHVEENHPSRAYALIIIAESKKIVLDLKSHAEWHDQMNEGHSSADD